MGKKYLVTFFVATTIFLSFFQAKFLSAHTEGMDGTISAMLHITPDDSPVAGANSKIIIEFNDSENTFSSSECDCRISIVKENKEIFGKHLFSKLHEEDALSTDVEFTFPEKGLYKIVLTGEPYDGHGAFKPFELVFDTRVDRKVRTSASPRFLVVCAICMLTLLVMGGLLLKLMRQKHE